MHHDCLEDYVNHYGYEYSDPKYLVSKGNVIFYNAGNGVLAAYFPENLTDEQLYQLDYLDGIFYFNAIKGNGEKGKEFLFLDNIKEQFSKVLLQSYYEKGKRK